MKADSNDIIKIIKEAKTRIDIQLLTEEADLRDIGADSLDMMNIFLEVQEKYDFVIPDERIETLSSVLQICKYIDEIKSDHNSTPN